MPEFHADCTLCSNNVVSLATDTLSTMQQAYLLVEVGWWKVAVHHLGVEARLLQALAVLDEGHGLQGTATVQTSAQGDNLKATVHQLR